MYYVENWADYIEWKYKVRDRVADGSDVDSVAESSALYAYWGEDLDEDIYLDNLVTCNVYSLEGFYQCEKALKKRAEAVIDALGGAEGVSEFPVGYIKEKFKGKIEAIVWYWFDPKTGNVFVGEGPLGYCPFRGA